MSNIVWCHFENGFKLIVHHNIDVDTEWAGGRGSFKLAEPSRVPNFRESEVQFPFYF